jgi:NAD(P)H dehydrogenase (quinone)
VNALIVHAHPEPRSFCSTLMRTARDELESLGHEVTVSDLYAEGFDPVLSAGDFTERLNPAFLRPMEEQAGAVAAGTLAADVARQVTMLREADLVVLTASMWWFSVPAMLKGWFDRVLVKGYAYGTVPSWSGPLGDKRALLVMTSSYTEGAFRAEGSIGDIATVLRPVTYGTLAYCGMQVLEPFLAYGADEVDDDTRARYLEALRARLGEL